MRIQSHQQLTDARRLQTIALENSIHEMRSLLIAGSYAKLLARDAAGPLTPVQRHYVEQIVESTGRLKDLFAFLSSIPQRDMTVTRTSLMSLLRSALEARGASYSLDENEACELYVLADRQKLHSALSQLLSAGFGQSRVHVSLLRQSDCVLIVLRPTDDRDTRPMAADVLDIRDMSLPTKTSRPSFKQCEEWIRLHGGLLWVRCSSSGRANEIGIRLPVDQSIPARRGAARA